MLKLSHQFPLFISPKFAESCPFALLKRKKLSSYKADILHCGPIIVFASYSNLKLRGFPPKKTKIYIKDVSLCISLVITYCETFVCISCGFHIFLCCSFKDKYTARMTNCFIIIKIVHSLSSDWIVGWVHRSQKEESLKLTFQINILSFPKFFYSKTIYCI
jgi:hypothetical protein